MALSNAPQPLRGRFSRTDLVDRVEASATVPLTLLLAPAGAGKSTLLSQWAALPSERHIVQMGLQPVDDDPVRFLRRFAEKTRAVVPAFDTSWFMPFDVSELPPSSIADALYDALQQVTLPLFIVFDDFQCITSPETLSVISVLLADPPTNVHLIIASRTQPLFDVTRLRLDDMVVEIGADDFKVSRTDVTNLNMGLGGEALNDQALDHLMAITEGWVAGVKIALLAAIRSGVETLQNFNASQPEIMAYFGHAVLKGLPDSARTLFMQSALLETFNAELCDEILQTHQSARLIEELTCRELFLMPVVGNLGSYRYHALLKDFLQERLKIDMPECIAPIHHRATHYFTRKRNFEQAVWHAQCTGNEEIFVSTLEKAFEFWLQEGYSSHILSWAEVLDDEQILSRVELAAPLISTLTFSRRFYRSRYYIDALKDRDYSGNTSVYSHEQTVGFLELHLQLFQHDTDFMEGADLSLLIENSSHRDIRAFSLAMLAYFHLQHGRLELALTVSTQAREVLLRVGQRFTAGYAGLISALANQQMGHIGEAVALITENFNNTSRDCPTWSLWATGMVVVLYDQNRLDEAQQVCEDLLPLVSSASATEVISTVYLTLSRLQHLQDKHKSAERMLEKLLGILQLGNYERFVSMTVLEMVRQAFITGNWPRMEAVVERFGLAEWVEANLADVTASYSQSWERRGLAAVYWLLGQGRHGQAEGVLRRLLAVVKSAGIMTRASIIDANLLLLTTRSSPAEEQAKMIDGLVARYGLLNINRTVFDEAPGLAGLMNRLWASGKLVLPEFYTTLFSTVFTAKPSNDPLEVDPDSVLTPKEGEIFSLLQSGLTNAQISQKTGVSVSTTKWHLKNIYSKLAVSSRTEAVLRATSR
jgi:LuxR family maltose regulon positive regulatory protein